MISIMNEKYFLTASFPIMMMVLFLDMRINCPLRGIS